MGYKKKIWERIVPFPYKNSRNWDIEFWQAQSAQDRFKAAFMMVVDYYRMKGKRINADTFRLQRSIENIKSTQS